MVLLDIVSCAVFRPGAGAGDSLCRSARGGSRRGGSSTAPLPPAKPVAVLWLRTEDKSVRRFRRVYEIAALFLSVCSENTGAAQARAVKSLGSLLARKPPVQPPVAMMTLLETMMQKSAAAARLLFSGRVFYDIITT